MLGKAHQLDTFTANNHLWYIYKRDKTVILWKIIFPLQVSTESEHGHYGGLKSVTVKSTAEIDNQTATQTLERIHWSLTLPNFQFYCSNSLTTAKAWVGVVPIKRVICACRLVPDKRMFDSP